MKSKEWVGTDTGHPGEVMEAGQGMGGPGGRRWPVQGLVDNESCRHEPWAEAGGQDAF